MLQAVTLPRPESVHALPPHAQESINYLEITAARGLAPQGHHLPYILTLSAPREAKTIEAAETSLALLQDIHDRLAAHLASQRDKTSPMHAVFNATAQQKDILTDDLKSERENMAIDLDDRFEDVQNRLHHLIYNDQICVIPESMTPLTLKGATRSIGFLMRPDCVEKLNEDALLKGCTLRRANWPDGYNNYSAAQLSCRL